MIRRVRFGTVKGSERYSVAFERVKLNSNERIRNQSKQVDRETGNAFTCFPVSLSTFILAL